MEEVAGEEVEEVVVEEEMVREEMVVVEEMGKVVEGEMQEVVEEGDGGRWWRRRWRR
jgi:hypothetical protein